MKRILIRIIMCIRWLLGGGRGIREVVIQIYKRNRYVRGLEGFDKTEWVGSQSLKERMVVSLE